MDIFVELTAYQATLEHVRAARERNPLSRLCEELEEDLEKARREMEIAWLQQAM